MQMTGGQVPEIQGSTTPIAQPAEAGRDWAQQPKRKNLQDAFVGSPDPLSEGANVDPDAPESVEFRIAEGTLRTQVAADTATDRALQGDQFYQLDLLLDGGTAVTFVIAQGADGVAMFVNGQAEPDLSAIGTEQNPAH